MNKKILIADDDPAIVDALRLILEEFGYKVITTYDGQKIYRMMKNGPDLLLLDIWMSGEDGRKICKYLKREKLTKNIPIIMISASHDIKKSATEAGADDFLAKPFDMHELITKIEKLTPQSH